MWVRSVRAGCVAAGCTVFGCTTLLGIDGDYRELAEGGSGASGTGGAVFDSGTETCDNGVDDDGDALADCADPKCVGVGFTCVPTAPAGWTAPVRWASGSGEPPSCAAPWDLEQAVGGVTVTVPSGATCPSCSCGQPSGTKCGMNVLFYDQPSCAGSSKAGVILSDGTCFNTVDQAFGPKSVKGTSAIEIVKGSCTPSSTGSKSIPAASLSDPARLCAASQVGAGCSGGQLCAPPSSDSAYCISKDGDHPCPSPFNDKQLLHQSLDDGRSCQPCTCATATGTCSLGEIRLADPNGGCSNQSVLSSSCANLQVHATTGHFTVNTTSGVQGASSCAPEGGQIIGTVTPQGTVTVCCIPGGRS